MSTHRVRDPDRPTHGDPSYAYGLYTHGRISFQDYKEVNDFYLIYLEFHENRRKRVRLHLEKTINRHVTPYEVDHFINNFID